MKTYFKFFCIYTALLILITYLLGWEDLINNKMLTGNWFDDLIKSITYYFGGVLVYWWLIILTVSTVLAFISIAITYGMKRLK